jgi:hypothetical protein
VELAYAPSNPKHVKPADPVILQLDIKNVPSLLIKVYEINTRTYYTVNKSEVHRHVTQNTGATCCRRYIGIEALSFLPVRLHLPPLGCLLTSCKAFFCGAAANRHPVGGVGSYIGAELRISAMSCYAAAPRRHSPGLSAGLLSRCRPYGSITSHA